ncbi:hypothetical protein [Zobellia galactanivorans]|uniref:hypothetical protein n=1 Tax=Zobellia galactanivorans (strain DSM 12802 / CCUG 47099 / CIP 106680 / NCIMB 13871 / Dsij) TaxID=63186 RepID=UPI001C076F10|nr:hypothetical protein [Zobellia galactanivorans]MBU3027561.1 hypothetical protein [Zobellia galactanivorans]
MKTSMINIGMGYTLGPNLKVVAKSQRYLKHKKNQISIHLHRFYAILYIENKELVISTSLKDQID